MRRYESKKTDSGDYDEEKQEPISPNQVVVRKARVVQSANVSDRGSGRGNEIMIQDANGHQVLRKVVS